MCSGGKTKAWPLLGGRDGVARHSILTPRVYIVDMQEISPSPVGRQDVSGGVHEGILDLVTESGVYEAQDALAALYFAGLNPGWT